MSTANGKASTTSTGDGHYGARIEQELLGVFTLTGAQAITDQYRSVLKLDPGGANRDVTLGADCEKAGRYFRFINAADAAENLVIKNSAAATIVTINQNEQAEVWYDGDANAWVLLCVTAIALS